LELGPAIEMPDGPIVVQLEVDYAGNNAFTADRLTFPAGLRGSSSRK
jgi:hypothetical protein